MRAFILLLLAVAGCWVSQAEVDEKIGQLETPDSGDTGDTGR